MAEHSYPIVIGERLAPNTSPQHPASKIVLRKSEGLPDWFVVERDDVEPSERTVHTSGNCYSFWTSARLSAACVEGTRAEMEALASAVLAGEACEFRRCAVDAVGHGPVAFWSPRNDEAQGYATREAAKAWANEVKRG